MANSVILYGDSINTQITVVDEEIIHIQKELKNKPAKKIPDYVTILNTQKVDWKVLENGDDLIIETPKLNISINKKGEIEYFSKEGEQILSELKVGTYIKDDSTATHKVSQAFKAGDEGLYGLGQFQSGRMNWKNVPVRLQQFNQEIANPVLISTKPYGIYWHNYSVTDFNLPKNEIQFTETLDEELNIRKAVFTPKKSGVYNFFVISETPFNSVKKKNKNRRLGPVIVTVNSETVIHYTTNWYPDSFSGEIMLEAGNEYEIIFQDTKAQTLGRLLYNEPNFNKTTFASKEGNAIDYYFIHGENPTKVLSEYSRLTGKAPLFPKSSYGFWQCREAYQTQEGLLESARQYRKRKIPVDNIVQDWDYWPKGVKGPEWDKSQYPDPKKMVDELDKMNLNLMVSVWPTVSHPQLCEKYDLENSKLTSTDFIDFYDSSTHKKYYQMLSDNMFKIGVQSIWLDGSEPIFTPNPEHQTPAGKFKELANTYSLLMTKAMYEGRRNEFPNERVFNLTRSAFAGQQRYGNAVWSGDVNGTWEQFSEQISAGLNFTMTGFPYWTTDIGGFFRDKNSGNPAYDNQYTDPDFRELLTRWFQFGTFSPIFRIHGYRTHTEIWNFGQEFEDVARKFIDLRYQLMPYIYSEAWEVTTKGKALMSPLVYQYPDDKNTWGIKDQYFFGKSLMICPVTTYKARERKVYLPEGNWYNFWTGIKTKGGKKVVASASLNTLPIFVKEGTILPYGPKRQYATEETNEPITLKIYPGKDAEYTLYFDDNESYDYEKGVYSEINISYSELTKTITLENGAGNYLDFSKNKMKFKVEVIGTGIKSEIQFEGKTIQKKLK
ncbi:glycoside hydrolase family 31 protein [Lutibacter citreus]|uniref:glycoside hydrolase family 31 protein n=1 Tax=Lutibacter citreus TaxID=2138210 RepID=UPI0015D09F5C|nr:TIM-barrel domain-containing protein [Lutibacter citreus]